VLRHVQETQELLRVCKEVASYLSTQKGMLAQDYAKDLTRAIIRIESSQKTSTEQGRQVDLSHEKRLQKRVPVAEEAG
jgi:hypothetical protein